MSERYYSEPLARGESKIEPRRHPGEKPFQDMRFPGIAQFDSKVDSVANSLSLEPDYACNQNQEE